MFTSYFGNHRNIVNPLAITGKPPAWFHGSHYAKLGPHESFLMDYKYGKIDDKEYIELYTKLVLDPLSPEETYKELVDLYGEDVTLCCYEKPPQFCHRYIVAIWFENNLGILIPELKYGKN